MRVIAFLVSLAAVAGVFFSVWSAADAVVDRALEQRNAAIVAVAGSAK